MSKFKMKLSEVARVTLDPRVNGPVETIIPKRATRAEVIRAVNESPGTSSAEICRYLGVRDITGPQGLPYYRNVSGALNSLVTRTKKPLIKRLKQDGKYRYYPVNHLAGTTHPGLKVDEALADKYRKRVVEDAVKTAEKEILKANAPKRVASQLTISTNTYLGWVERKAKDYFWESQTTDLREFIEWLKK